jgi:hypothetical protein
MDDDHQQRRAGRAQRQMRYGSQTGNLILLRHSAPPLVERE